MTDELQQFSVDSKFCGVLNVYVQGSLDEKQGKTVFLTVHDMGTNHKSFEYFVTDPAMQEVKSRSIFLHVCMPGQEEGAPDYKKDYPSLTQVSHDLICVLDKFDVKTCIGFGEGAGANVICRFAITYPNRVMGVCLVHCTSTTAGVMEYMKDKYITMKLESGVMHSAAWDYLSFHKFGPKSEGEHVKEFMEKMKKSLNPNNLAKYMQSFVNRTDLSAALANDLKVETLLVVGSKASHLHTVYTMHQSMNREKTTLLVVDGVGDVITEAPERLTRALVLFCKGCGVLSGVGMPGMERQRTLSSSMEEADRPRRFSVPTGPPTMPHV